jgi:hypothetical protein
MFSDISSTRTYFSGDSGIVGIPRIAVMKLALSLAAHERPNILAHDYMMVSRH